MPKQCRRCGALNWPNSDKCCLCGFSLLSEIEEVDEQLSLRSALLMAAAIRKQSIYSFETLRAVFNDICPTISDDYLVMSAMQRAFPLLSPREGEDPQFGHARLLLSQGRHPYPQQVIDEVVLAFSDMRAYLDGGPEAIYKVEAKHTVADSGSVSSYNSSVILEHVSTIIEAINRRGDGSAELIYAHRAYSLHPDSVPFIDAFAHRIIPLMKTDEEFGWLRHMLLFSASKGSADALSMLESICDDHGEAKKQNNATDSKSADYAEDSVTGYPISGAAHENVVGDHDALGTHTIESISAGFDRAFIDVGLQSQVRAQDINGLPKVQYAIASGETFEVSLSGGIVTLTESLSFCVPKESLQSVAWFIALANRELDSTITIAPDSGMVSICVSFDCSTVTEIGYPVARRIVTSCIEVGGRIRDCLLAISRNRQSAVTAYHDMVVRR